MGPLVVWAWAFSFKFWHLCGPKMKPAPVIKGLLIVNCDYDLNWLTPKFKWESVALKPQNFINFPNLFKACQKSWLSVQLIYYREWLRWVSDGDVILFYCVYLLLSREIECSSWTTKNRKSIFESFRYLMSVRDKNNEILFIFVVIESACMHYDR